MLVYNNNTAQNRHNNSKSIITFCIVLTLFYFIFKLWDFIGKNEKKEGNVFLKKSEMPTSPPIWKNSVKYTKVMPWYLDFF